MASTVRLRVAEDFYLDNARFSVAVDGVTVGGVNSVFARRGSEDLFTFSGEFGAGPHVVTVRFLNDAYGGTDQTDRNLIVEGISFDGVSALGVPTILYGNEARDFAVPPPGPDTLTLRLAEDFYQSDALFAVSVDGVRVGTGTVTARRGSEQSFTFAGSFGTGAHTVTLDFLNDAYGGTDQTDRNLIVEGISFNGVSALGAPTILYAAGARDFAVPGPVEEGIAPVLLRDVAAGLGGFKISAAVPGSRTLAVPVSGENRFDGADFNGDDRPDFAVFVQPGPSSDTGLTPVLFGRAGDGSVDLGAVNGGSGDFAVTGAPRGTVLARVVGDVNGDGTPDLAFAQPLAAGAGFEFGGRVVVVFGRAGGTVDYETAAAGNGGFQVLGNGRDNAGNSLTGAGDFNGDGLADLLFTAPGAGRFVGPSPSLATGAAYVVYGKADGAAVRLGNVDVGANGTAVIGESVFDRPAVAAGPGDVNGDGRADLLVGTSAGTAFVVFGNGTGSSTDLRDVRAGRGGFMIEGNTGPNTALSAPGDVNGDGLADVLVGAGTAYLVFGKADAGVVRLADVAAGQGGFSITSQVGTAIGAAAGVGDANGDGLDDVLLGVSRDDPSTGATLYGAAFLVFGRTGGATVDLDAVLAGTSRAGVAILGEADTDGAGFPVSAAGDVNGDGLADLLVGALGNDALGRVDAGAAYVVYGRADWFAG